ncbi:MAG: hypothetical protein II828_03185 [Clostridia bacterium]|nr:hypothetical protein [Clostridia bacterium]
MLFHTYGEFNAPKLLLMHGMLNDWHIVYDKMKSLADKYYLIIPAMDGCYDGSGDFTSFADQCRQIEEYVGIHLGGKLDLVYGISQGATLMDELLCRNKIEIRVAILDGLYVARQGALVGKLTARQLLKTQKNGGELPWGIKHIMMPLMGMDEKDMAAFNCLYLGFSKVTAERNAHEQYTYTQSPEIAKTNAKIYLWCGSKEPYAIKSHHIIKRYITNYEETVFDGCAHGELFFFQPEKLCEMISEIGRKLNGNAL